MQKVEKKKSGQKRAGKKVSLTVLDRWLTWQAIQQITGDELDTNKQGHADSIAIAKRGMVFEILEIDEVLEIINEKRSKAIEEGDLNADLPDGEHDFKLRYGMFKWVQKKMKDANLAGMPLKNVLETLAKWGVEHDYQDLFGKDDTFDEDTEFLDEDEDEDENHGEKSPEVAVDTN